MHNALIAIVVVLLTSIISLANGGVEDQENCVAESQYEDNPKQVVLYTNNGCLTPSFYIKSLVPFFVIDDFITKDEKYTIHIGEACTIKVSGSEYNTGNYSDGTLEANRHKEVWQIGISDIKIKHATNTRAYTILCYGQPLTRITSDKQPKYIVHLSIKMDTHLVSNWHIWHPSQYNHDVELSNKEEYDNAKPIVTTTEASITARPPPPPDDDDEDAGNQDDDVDTSASAGIGSAINKHMVEVAIMIVVVARLFI